MNGQLQPSFSRRILLQKGSRRTYILFIKIGEYPYTGRKNREMEISSEKLDALVDRISELYISYRKRYVLCLPGGRLLTPKRKGEQYSVLTSNVVKNHLLHKYAVAIFAGPSTSRFICFDVDDGQKETVHGILEVLVKLGFPREQIYVSYSGGKGFHVEMFFDQLVKTSILKSLYVEVIEATGFNPRKVEFRPTHGSAIKLPLSTHARTRNMCWFVDRETLEMIERADYPFEIRQIPASLVYRIVSENGLLAKSVSHENARAAPAEAMAEDAQDLCKAQIREGIEIEAEGTRHILMRRLAVFMRKSGQSKKACEDMLIRWYERQDQSLIRSDREEVMRDIRELLEWVFSDRFHLSPPAVPTGINLSATDMKLVLSMENRSSRRILFLLLVRSIACKTAIALSEIAATTGISRKTVLKTTTKLRKRGIILCESGARLQVSEGSYVSERNRYTVPHYRGNKAERQLELQLEDVMKRFDACYHHAIHDLLTLNEIRKLLPADELAEHLSFIHTTCQENDGRLDLCGSKRVYQSDEYGRIDAYVLGKRTLYPLTEVAKLIGWKHPEAIAVHCKEKERWKVRTERQVVTKNYIDQEQLMKILQRCRSKKKGALMDWLCQR